MPSLFHSEPRPDAPHIDHVHPHAAMPGGEVALHGRNLGAPTPSSDSLPQANIGDTPARTIFSRASQTILRVPEGSISGDLVLHRNGSQSNAVSLRVAVPMAENLHPVANPA